MTKKQRGFTIVEVLIVIVIVGLLGAVGWLVYDRQKSDDNSSQRTTTQDTSGQKPTANTDQDKKDEVSEGSYLTVEQWGIKIPVTSATSGLTYSIKDKIAYFRTAGLNNVSADGCTSNSVAVARGKANEIVPNSLGSNDGDTFMQAYDTVSIDPSAMTARSLKAKAGDYYYVVPGFSAASCADETNADKETAHMIEIVKAINQLSAK